MEENVALDSGKQKKFVKSIRGIKKLIKKNEKKEAKSETKQKDEGSKPEKPFSMRLKHGKIKKRKERGLVYLSHIPHGFYEHQMTEYFKQFGVVTNARVIKSKRTGNSKGFAFVEFKEPSVAQIVAETMNNYLMGKRLIKAVYIEPEKQKRRAFRKHWNTVHNPTSVRRLKLKKEFNAVKDATQEIKKARKLLANLNKTKKRLSELGINYDFFTPVDVPEVLLNTIIKKEVDDDIIKDDKEKKSKNNNKAKIEKKQDKKVEQKLNNNKENQKEKIEKVNKKVDHKGKNNKNKEQKTNELNTVAKKEVASKGNKGGLKKSVKVNQTEQKEKEQTLKKAGVKSVEEFISLNADGSDDSCEFDSDEYEKMIGEDDDYSSSDGSPDDESEEEDNEDVENSESDEEIPSPKKGKSKVLPKVTQTVKTSKQTLMQQTQKVMKTKQFKPSNLGKRKISQEPAAAPKKLKFEKQKQKPMKKQFKKK